MTYKPTRCRKSIAERATNMDDMQERALWRNKRSVKRCIEANMLTTKYCIRSQRKVALAFVEVFPHYIAQILLSDM
jgi:hypothetical protein